MRRKDREVTETEHICEIIDSCKVFRIAMSVKDVPYMVPLNFGYRYADGAFQFFFHCAGEGKKIRMLKENSQVCFEMDGDHQLTEADMACGYGYLYKSVIGMGQVDFVTDTQEKAECLCHIMKHQTGRDFIITKEQAAPVTVCKITVSEITAKQRTVL